MAKKFSAFHPDKDIIYPYPLSRDNESVLEELTVNKTIATLTNKNAKAVNLVRQWGMITATVQPALEQHLVELLGIEQEIDFQSSDRKPRVYVTLTIHEMARAVSLPKTCPKSHLDAFFQSKAADFELFDTYMSRFREHLSVSHQAINKEAAMEEAVKLRDSYNNPSKEEGQVAEITGNEDIEERNYAYIIRLKKALRRIPRDTLGVMVLDSEGTGKELKTEIRGEVGTIAIPSGGEYRTSLGIYDFVDLPPEICLTTEDCASRHQLITDRYLAQINLPVELKIPYLESIRVQMGKMGDEERLAIIEQIYKKRVLYDKVLHESKTLFKAVCPTSKKEYIVLLHLEQTQSAYGDREKHTHCTIFSIAPFMTVGWSIHESCVRGFMNQESLLNWTPADRFTQKFEPGIERGEHKLICIQLGIDVPRVTELMGQLGSCKSKRKS